MTEGGGGRTKGQVTVIALSAACLLGAAALLARGPWGRPAAWAWPALALGVAISEIAVVHLPLGRQRWTFSCTEALIAAAFALATGGWIPVAVLVGVLVAQVVRRQVAIKVVFNVAQFARASAAGATVAQVALDRGAGRFAAAALALAVFWLANHVLVALAVALTGTASLWRVLATSAPLSLLHTGANGSVGLLGGWLALHAPFGLLALFVPVALLWSSYDQQTRRAAEVRLFAELAHGQERAGGRSVDSSAGVIVNAAARLFGGADVELLVLAPDGPVLYVGAEIGSPVRRRLGPECFDEPWVLRALTDGGVITGTEGGRPFFSAAIGSPDAPHGVLLARRPAGSGGLDRREALLVGVLAQQAAAWLSAADLAASRDAALNRVEAAGVTAKALGDLGFHTTPALSVLRDSTRRLAHLAGTAEGEPDAVTGIVEELHSVEQAVASLLGAIALAADPDLATGSRPEVGVTAGVTLGQERTADGGQSSEWTSSGTLELEGSR